MARLVGPDDGSRLAYQIRSDNGLSSASGLTAVYYADEAATILADIITYPGGAAIPGSAMTVAATSLLPLFQFPDGADTVYVKVNGGPVTAVYSRVEAGDVLTRAANLADLQSASAARTNLGLGDSAVADIGTAADTVAAGDHTHAGGGGFTGAWSSATAYSVGQMATHSNWLIAAKTAHTNQVPYSTRQLDGGTPGTIDGGDAASYNMGVKLSTSRPLVLTTAAFYKASTNTGTHVATLFAVVPAGFPNATSNVIMAQKTFTGESASGWQSMTLDFLLMPGVSYTLAVLMPAGHYSFNSGYFATQIVVGSVTFPAGAGVFTATSNADVPPVTAVGNAHYWIDLSWSEPDTTNWTEVARFPVLGDGPRFGTKAAA